VIHTLKIIRAVYILGYVMAGLVIMYLLGGTDMVIRTVIAGVLFMLFLYGLRMAKVI
jgi:hypothetical protein